MFKIIFRIIVNMIIQILAVILACGVVFLILLLIGLFNETSSSDHMTLSLSIFMQTDTPLVMQGQLFVGLLLIVFIFLILIRALISIYRNSSSFITTLMKKTESEISE